jgi:hypothetical protein
MPATTSLLIAESQELIRLGVRAMLTGTSIKIVGEAPDAKSTLTLAKKHKPAVNPLDVAIPPVFSHDMRRRTGTWHGCGKTLGTGPPQQNAENNSGNKYTEDGYQSQRPTHAPDALLRPRAAFG